MKIEFINGRVAYFPETEKEFRALVNLLRASHNKEVVSFGIPRGVRKRRVVVCRTCGQSGHNSANEIHKENES